MTDMLVKLYSLPPQPEVPDITIRRALAAERHLVLAWVTQQFSAGWADECALAYARLPIACFIATQNGRILGISCYEATARGVFGPVGVETEHRQRRVGQALTLAALHDMRAQGYAYAVIGGVLPNNFAFYEKTAAATPISGSNPEDGMYRGMLKTKAD